MDSYNLKTASTYINNLLLARGLLRDGKPIEFVHPSRGEGGKEVTMAQIINLVHDLILKRDRDQAHRESIANTLRTLRSESSRQTLALEKLQTRNDDLARQLSLAQSQERAARAALRTAESSARTLREEMLRLKTTVQQVRTSCANDIRKRDVQIQKLKSHLMSQQRGNKTGLVGASITITPGGSGNSGRSLQDEDGPGLEDPEYSLKQETTEFLTQLSQGLSDENDGLIGLVRSAVFTLRELQGMPEQRHGEGDVSVVEEENADGVLVEPSSSYEALAADMDEVLENLKTLLTNPNFVPIEEVESREEEIVRLRAGWEKMETRWRDALTLMEGWRKRMANGGDTINLDELKMGLGLGIGLETVNKDDVSMMTEEDLDSEGDAEIDDDTVEELDHLPSEEADDIPTHTSPDIFKVKLQAGDQQALREGSNGNIRSPVRKVSFAPSIPNTPSKAADENASEMDLVDTGSGSAPHPSPSKPDVAVSSIEPISSSRTRIKESRIPRQTISPRKKRPSTSPHPCEPSPKTIPTSTKKLSIQDKLAAAQAEAEAATATATRTRGSAADEGSSAPQARGRGVSEVPELEDGVAKRRVGSPVKRRGVGRGRRRKSTLTPEELQGLLGV